MLLHTNTASKPGRVSAKVIVALFPVFRLGVHGSEGAFAHPLHNLTSSFLLAPLALLAMMMILYKSVISSSRSVGSARAFPSM